MFKNSITEEMNMLIVLFVAIVSAKKGYVIDIDDDYDSGYYLPSFALIEPKVCHYLGLKFNKAGDELVKAGMPANALSVYVKYTKKGAEIKSYTDDACTQGETIVISEDFNNYYKDIPVHSGFKNVADSEQCPHQRNALRTYYRDECKSAKTASGQQVYTKMEAQGRELALTLYNNEGCTDQGTLFTKVGFCGFCDQMDGNYHMVQCGTKSILVAMIFLIIVLLF